MDQFVLAKLEAHGIEPALEASKEVLIRRATFDLTGLPPTPEEVDEFVNSTDPQAWQEVIDRLLASPHYGERWGRHWLDLVRYADTNGFERDSDKPAAWRYRDWVINAFNSDKPYDRFIIEQLAGDELPDRNFDTLVATGYYRLGMWDDEVPDLEQALADDMDGIIDTTARSMLGVGLGCARCHDHKGDPISQADYYSFAAYFAGLRPYKSTAGNSIESGNVMRSVTREFGSANPDAALRQWREKRERLVNELLAIEASANASAVDRAPADGLVAHYAFETAANAPEAERAILADSARTEHGKVVDVGFTTDGRFGSCGTFDGGDDRISIPRSIGDDFTISLWFKSDRIAAGSDEDARWFTGAGLVDGEVPGIVDDFGLSIIAGGTVAAGVGNPETFVHSSRGFNDGQWHHVAFTRTRANGEITLWVDGVLAMRAKGGSQELRTPDRLVIGGMHPGSGAFTGSIDEVRIYNRALNPSEVLSIATGIGSGETMPKALAASTDPSAETKWTMGAKELASMQPPADSTTAVLCAAELPDPRRTHVLLRGSPHAPADEVQPAVPQVLASVAADSPLEVHRSESSGRRLALANWITDAANPLASRTMANRVWQFHFGRGLCPTPNDFGHLGELPTHPELLDFLAGEFVRNGWSMKAMHRYLMNSAAYRMSSVPQKDALAKDPGNELLSRFRLRRMESESLRDALLAVNGSLNPQAGGPGFRPPMPTEVLATSSRPDEVWPLTEPASWTRRSVYIHAKRSLIHPMLSVFDQADIDSSCPVRFTTVQPTQALTMLNGELVNQEARVFAQRLRREFPNDASRQVERGMRLAFGRSIPKSEIDDALAFIEELQALHGVSVDAALDLFALAIYNSNEFAYVD